MNTAQEMPSTDRSARAGLPATGRQGPGAVSAPVAGPDIRMLRDALAADLVAAVVVAHPGGRDGLGDVGEVAMLSGLLEQLEGHDAVELVTRTRVVRLTRSSGRTVIAAFPRRPEVLARIDWIMPVEFRPAAVADTATGPAVPSLQPVNAGSPPEISPA